MNPTTTQSAVAPRFRGLMLIWMAIIFSLVTFFVITRFLPAAEAGDVAQPTQLFWIFAALGFATFSSSFLFKAWMLSQASKLGQPQLASTAYIIAFALCEATGLCGFVAHLITGSPYAAYLFALGALGLLLHKPKQEHLLNASTANNVAGEIDSPFGRNG
ncbi:MAG: hypothetical protein H0T45_19965 [Pyrinomonadaceae bacterium]|nr:hypothetical protein [Pyrinomonadaceae bacterium]